MTPAAIQARHGSHLGSERGEEEDSLGMSLRVRTNRVCRFSASVPRSPAMPSTEKAKPGENRFEEANKKISVGHITCGILVIQPNGEAT